MKKILLFIMIAIFSFGQSAIGDRLGNKFIYAQNDTIWIQGLGYIVGMDSLHVADLYAVLLQVDSLHVTELTADSITVNEYYYQIEIGVVDSATAWVSDGDTLTVNPTTSLYLLEWLLDGSRKFSVDSLGNIYTVVDVTADTVFADYFSDSDDTTRVAPVIKNSGGSIQVKGSFEPSDDNSHDSGHPDRRWSSVYSVQLMITDATKADTMTISDDGDTTRIVSDNPIKVGNQSLIIKTDGKVQATGDFSAKTYETNVTATELGYVSSVTSDIQTQLDGKEGTLTNSAGLASALSDETGTGNAVFSTAPDFTGPVDVGASGSNLGLKIDGNKTTGDLFQAINDNDGSPGDSAATITKLGVFKSYVPVGTAPFSITSTTVNPNLNADLLDGEEASAFQDADAELSALAGLTSAANAIPYFTGSGTADVISSSANMVSLLGSADYATARTNLGLAIGSDVQAYSATLLSLAGLTETNGGIPYGTADNAYAWLAAGTANYLLQGNGAAAPSWTTSPSITNLTLTTNLTNQDNTFSDTDGEQFIYNYHIKTAGASDQADDYTSFYNWFQFNQAGGEIGHMMGIYNRLQLDAGTIGDGQEDFTGMWHILDINGGTIGRDVYGARYDIDIEDITSLAGDVFGLRIQIDDDEGAGGTVHGIYVDDLSGVDYALWLNGGAPAYFGGKIISPQEYTWNIGCYDFVTGATYIPAEGAVHPTDAAGVMYAPFKVPYNLIGGTIVIDQITVYYNTDEAGDDFDLALVRTDVDGSITIDEDQDDMGNAETGVQSATCLAADLTLSDFAYYIEIDANNNDTNTDVKIYQIKIEAHTE